MSSITFAPGVALDPLTGKLPTSVIPAVALTETYPVADAAARLALDVEIGDLAIQADTGVNYILSALPASVDGNWIPMGATPSTTSTHGGVGNAGKTLVLDAAGKADGRELSVDGAKLDLIEAAADVTDFANVSAALAAATGGVSLNGQTLTADVAGTASGNLTSFQGRAAQAAVLTKADVTGTGLTYSDVGAEVSGAAAAVQTNLTAHMDDVTAAHAASAISYTPDGGVAATNVQDAIDELDTDKVATSALGDASGVATLDGSTLVVQNPANATQTPTASKIPIANSGNAQLAQGWIASGAASADRVPVSDGAGGTSWQAVPATAGVASLAKTGGAARTGALTLTEGTNVTITDNGDGTFTIAASGSGSALTGGHGEWRSGISKGTTKTAIMRWTTTVHDTHGGYWTFTDSVADGSYWTILAAGLYSFAFSLNSTGTSTIKRATALNNNAASGDTDQLASGNGNRFNVSVDVWCAINDIVWVANDGTPGAYAEINRISVARLR